MKGTLLSDGALLVLLDTVGTFFFVATSSEGFFEVLEWEAVYNFLAPCLLMLLVAAMSTVFFLRSNVPFVELRFAEVFAVRVIGLLLLRSALLLLFLPFY